jgi:hypothetical protein
VYLSPGHTTIIEPVVVIEGFDYDNTMNWDELYALLNRQELIERLRSLGFDAIVLNFTDAVDYIQRNGFVAVELLQQTEETVPAGTTIAVAGASMGGLIGRYALCYMEAHAMPAAVRTFLAFDSPHNGANIPLGLQYWLAFFADDSPDAAALLAALDTPGARQMLVYHHTDPPGATGESDPLRAQFLADLAAVGDYPDLPRTVAIANGSGAGANEGFAAGEQIILWEYYSFLVDIIGNVWAVPQAGSQQILQGMIDIILLPPDELDVTVAGTRPYDNAPGGWRASMAEMDATPAPYGDIIALYPSHCFIPTVSALAVDTADLFYDIAGDPDLLSHTPFDAVYFPAENQEHVDLTAENAQWFIDEIVQGATGIADDPLAGRDSGVGGIADGMRIDAVCPHPVTASACVRFHLPQAGRASLALYDPAGRRIALLVQGECEAGEREAHWNGLDDRGARVASGMYFLRLVSAGASASRRIVVR